MRQQTRRVPAPWRARLRNGGVDSGLRPDPGGKLCVQTDIGAEPVHEIDGFNLGGQARRVEPRDAAFALKKIITGRAELLSLGIEGNFLGDAACDGPGGEVFARWSCSRAGRQTRSSTGPRWRRSRACDHLRRRRVC